MPNNNDMMKKYLDKCGVKHSQLGYKYLVTVFMIMDSEIDKRTNITDIYEQVAEIHDSLAKNIEKAIYYAIKHLGITNKEFIYRAIDNNFTFINSRSRAVRSTDRIKVLA